MSLRKICYVVAYRDPEYIRTRTLKAALQKLDGCIVFDATNTRSGWLRYFETLLKTIWIRIQHNPDIYILGFRGHEIFLPVRLISLGKRLVFDEFMSPSAALTIEKKAGALGKLIGYLLYPIEKMCLHLSGRCLTDTEAHLRFIGGSFGIRGSRISVVYVGADTDTPEIGPIPTSLPLTFEKPLTVLFYGTFLPLHGIDVILKACHLMAGRPVQFQIIGGKGKQLSEFHDLRHRLNIDNVIHKPWVDFEELKSVLIPQADLCLGGPFGGTPQAKRVITGKTFQFLAQAKATVIGRTYEPVEFVDRENCLLVDQANPEQLAMTLDWAVANRSHLPMIGWRGRQLYCKRFSVDALSKQLAVAIGVQD